MNYSTPEVNRKTLWNWIRLPLVLGVHFVLLLMIVLVLARFVSGYVVLFDKESLELPEITVRLVSWSWFFQDYWYLVLLLGMALDLVSMVLLTWLASRATWPRALYEYIWLLGTCLILFWISLCLAMPIEKLGQALID